MDGGLKVVAGGHLYRQVRPCHCRAFSTAMVAKTLPFSCVSTAMSTLAFVAKTLPSWQRDCLRGEDTCLVFSQARLELHPETAPATDPDLCVGPFWIAPTR